MGLVEILWGGIDLIDLIPDMVCGGTIVSTVMNLRFHKKLRSSSVTSQMATCREEFNYTRVSLLYLFA
jgi:hypothetical protein